MYHKHRQNGETSPKDSTYLLMPFDENDFNMSCSRSRTSSFNLDYAGSRRINGNKTSSINHDHFSHDGSGYLSDFSKETPNRSYTSYLSSSSYNSDRSSYKPRGLGGSSYSHGDYQRRHYKGRQTKEIDLTPLLDVLKRIDAIDTSMEGRRKMKNSETTLSEASTSYGMSENSDFISDSPLTREIPSVSWPSSSYDHNSGHDCDLIEKRKCNNPSALKRYNTRHEIDTLDGISNISSDEEFLSETEYDNEEPETDSESWNKDKDNSPDESDEMSDHIISKHYRKLSLDKDKKKESELNPAGLKTSITSVKFGQPDGNTVKLNKIDTAPKNEDSLDKPADIPGHGTYRHHRKLLNEKEDKGKPATEKDQETSYDVNMDYFDQIYEALDNESSDSEGSEMSWRSRGYNTDFFVSRRSLVGSEIINWFKRTSNRSSRCTTPRKLSNNSGTSSLAKPSRIAQSAPVTRVSSDKDLAKDDVNLKYSDMYSAPTTRRTSGDMPLTRSSSSGSFRTATDTSISIGFKSENQNTQGQGSGVKVSELRAALEREIAKNIS